MQRNLKRMFAETPSTAGKKPRQLQPDTSPPATARDAAATAAKTATALAAAAATPSRASAQLRTDSADALLRPTLGPSVSERFEAAEARRASTNPTLLEHGQLRVGGELVAQLMNKQTWQPTVASEQPNADNLYWQRVPCKERPWVGRLPG
jgi:hypothetical protein